MAATAYIATRVDPADAEALARLSRESRHSQSAELRQALRRWIEDAPRRAEADQISRMSDAERRAYLAAAGADDGCHNDERPARGESGALSNREAKVAGHGET